MFGQGVALLGLVLLIFEPNVLANGPLVTTDLAASCFIFASIYSFYRYIKSPGWWRLCVCGLAVTLAFASKHSSLILVPILVLLAASELLFCRRAESSSLRKQTPRLAAALAFTFYWIHGGSKNKEVDEWLEKNPEKVSAFLNWSKQYQWPQKKG